MTLTLLRTIALAAVASAGACASSTPPAGIPADLPIGTWGGDNAGVIVNDTIAHVHIGCTFGDIKGIVPLTADGRFNMPGTYVLRAYPVYLGPELPAQFSGVVDGNRLTISVAVNDTVSKKPVALGPVTVILGTDPRMGPCPICKTPGDRARMLKRRA